MKWHLTEEELPEEKRLVIAYVPARCWNWHGKGDIHYALVWLVKGISQQEREKMPLTNKRKYNIYSQDEYGNNLVPYCWEEFGPNYFFGQEVKAWAYFEEYKGEQR